MPRHFTHFFWAFTVCRIPKIKKLSFIIEIDPICSNIHVVCTGYVKSCWKATHGWNNGLWQVLLEAKEGRISNELWFHMGPEFSDPKNDEWVRCQNLPVENPLHFLTWCSRGTKTKPSRHGAYKSLFKIWILDWEFNHRNNFWIWTFFTHKETDKN